MRLDGIYTGPNINVLDGIRATGTPDEFARVGPLPRRAEPGLHATGMGEYDEDGHHVVRRTVDIPAAKPLVERIARATEIECDDRRLIDWMRAQERG